MSTRGRMPLPKSIVVFRTAFEGAEVPDDVCAVMDAVLRAWTAEAGGKKPIAVLNQAFGQLRRQRPTCFQNLANWLADSATQRVASASGVGWAWLEWSKAAAALMGGATANVAFGVSGKSKSDNFTQYEDAAILAEYLHRFDGIPSEAATAQAIASVAGDEELDRRGVQRHRKMVRESGAPLDEIAEQGELVRRKYAGR